MKRILALFLCLMMLVSCAKTPSGDTSSAETPTAELVELNNVGEYTIIMPTDRDDAVKDAVMALRDALGEVIGDTMPFSTDKKDAGDDVKEILVGATTRAQSNVGVKYDDYVIKQDGNKIVIAGGSYSATAQAVDWFIKNCIADKVTVPSTPYEVKRDYSYENVKVNSILLKDYAVEDTKLAQEIAKLTGIVAKTEGENKIVLSADDSLGAFDLSVKTSGKNIELKVKDPTSVIGIKDALANVLGKENHDSIDTVATLSNDMIKELDFETLEKWQSESDKKRDEIINSPNMEIPSGATVYYFSNKGNDSNDGKSPATAFKTLEKLANITLNSGDFVLFERGGFWRGLISCKEGVTYSAYGEGAKPVITSSPEDGANPSLWREVGNNVWAFDTKHWGFERWASDVGTMIFNGGESWAVKYLPFKGKNDTQTYAYGTDIVFTSGTEIKEDLAFYHDTGAGTLYLCSKENPGERFDSIEFNTRRSILSIGANNVTIDNLCIKYTGAHGVGAGTVKNLTVQNCEFGYIGGSLHQSHPTEGYPIRYGNAVQIYGGCDGYYVKDNYIYQIYDAAITHQYSDYEMDNADDPKWGQRNVEYSGNVIEYTVYPFEIWLGIDANTSNGIIDNVIKDNYVWHTGEGLGSQRPDKGVEGFVTTWAHNNRYENVLFENNVMVGTTARLFDICTKVKRADGTFELPSFKNNRFAATQDVLFGCIDAQVEEMKEFSPKVINSYKQHFNGDIFYIIKE